MWTACRTWPSTGLTTPAARLCFTCSPSATLSKEQEEEGGGGQSSPAQAAPVVIVKRLQLSPERLANLLAGNSVDLAAPAPATPGPVVRLQRLRLPREILLDLLSGNSVNMSLITQPQPRSAIERQPGPADHNSDQPAAAPRDLASQQAVEPASPFRTAAEPTSPARTAAEPASSVPRLMSSVLYRVRVYRAFQQICWQFEAAKPGAGRYIWYTQEITMLGHNRYVSFYNIVVR